MIPRLILLLIWFCWTSNTSAQTYNYTQYKIEQGLAGNIVYAMIQDKEGFMWFATETGVSQFDGTSFRNFTTSDGLPDNSTLRIYADTKGRVWFLPFRNAISYYYKGKIYNQQDDTTLRKMSFTGIIHDVVEDKDQNIILATERELYILTPDGKVLSRKGAPELSHIILQLAKDDSGRVRITLHNYCVYEVKLDKLIPLRDFEVFNKVQWVIKGNTTYWRTGTGFHVRIGDSTRKYELPAINSFRMINDAVAYLSTPKGCIVLDTRQIKEIDRFLPDYNVSNSYMDGEGNYWFATLNDGVFRLQSRQFKCIRQLSDGKPMRIYALWDNGNDLLIGTGNAFLKLDFKHDWQIRKELPNYFDKPVSSIENKGRLLITSAERLYYRTKEKRWIDTLIDSSIKELATKPDGQALVATSFGLYQFDMTSGSRATLLYVGRTTTVYVVGDSIYLGTPKGLYTVRGENDTTYWGDIHPNFRRRISAICRSTDSILWVATVGAGIIGLKNKKPVWKLDTSRGLGSNDCRVMAPDKDGALWVGTDKGLDYLTFKEGKVNVINYTRAHGLTSGFINALVIKGDTVFVGTPEGLTYFDKRETVFYSQCNLRMLNISSGSKTLEEKDLLALHYGKNQVHFDFTAISFKSEGDIKYYYRLLGQDTVWKAKRQNFLEFISLPPGEYQLELFALNKFRVKSETIRISLKVIPPFWQTAWFIVTAIAVIILATRTIVTRKNKRVNKRMEMDRQMEQRLHALEQKALRAQMNPHFIFNCLHAVQQYILENDIIKANKYLSSFARLIRKTLDNSLQTMIPIADELAYLTNYLNLEQLRVEGMFDYTFDIDSELDINNTCIPSMMLQPYIENAIRHGIEYKKEKKGMIRIAFKKIGQHVICLVEDNGIGRTAAQALKNNEYNTHQSRGMQLTAERLQLLSRELNAPIAVNITDVMEIPGLVAGTRVTIHLPIIIT